ncbi:hypothetical protein ACVIGB_000486 [Bradyrhizobium sp. USDA 4341]
MSANTHPPAPRAVAFVALPPDMQVLVSDFVSGQTSLRGVPEFLPLVEIAVRRIPIVELNEDDRGTDHAMAMDLDVTPPIIVAEGHFMDGRHRSYKARLDNRSSLDAIDLTGIIDQRMLAYNSMGMLLDVSDDLDEAPVPGL